MIGSTVENYQIVGLLGEGGMGIVYRAFDMKLERYAAIKILTSHAVKNPQFVERFKREAKNQAKLNHPNIVPVYGFTEQNDMLGIVMEMVEGETLEKMIERKGKLELNEALQILKQVLLGVDYAHKKGFVHRDLKPSNIIISNEGIVKIMDFGISKSMNELNGLTRTGTKIGTILYMSPEQVKAQEPSAQSDIYSLGITLYEMLAGVTPFDRNTEYAIMEAHLKTATPKLSGSLTGLPSEVDKIISKATAKLLSKRYNNCEEFIRDIDAFLKNEPGRKEQKSKPPVSKIVKPDGKSNFKDKLRFALFAAVFISVIAALFIFIYSFVSDFWKSKKYLANREVVTSAVRGTEIIKFTKADIKTNASISSVCFADDSLGIACGSEGVILRTTDGGTDWSTSQDSSGKNLSKVVYNNGKFFIAGDNGILLVSTDMGLTWKNINTGFSNSFFNIRFADNSTGFITAAKGLLLKTTDSGIVWRQIPVSVDKNLFGIFISSNSNLYIVGWDGQFLKSTDLGSSWSKNNKICDKYLRSVFFIDDNTGFTVGGGGEIYKTKNSGQDWSKVYTDIISGLMKVYFLNRKEGYILGAKGEILHTNDSGESWQLVPSDIYYALTDITKTVSGRIFISGHNGTLLYK